MFAAQITGLAGLRIHWIAWWRIGAPEWREVSTCGSAVS
jgi:hypothetical protein